MAIDYNAGITSIDAGAPDIKYTGDEGPKSPDQMKLEGIMQMASDDANERVLEQIFEQLLEEGFSPEEAAIKAKEIFDQRAMATGGRVGFFQGALADTKEGKAMSPGTSARGASRHSGADDRREQARVASTMGRTAPTPQEVRNIVSESPYIMSGGKKHYRGSEKYNEEIEKSQEIVKEHQEKKPPVIKSVWDAIFKQKAANARKYVTYLKSQNVTIPDWLREIDESDAKYLTEEQEQLLNYGWDPELAKLPPAMMSELDYRPMNYGDWKASQGNFGILARGDLGNLKDLPNPGTVINPKTGLPFTDYEWDMHKRASGQGASSYDRGPSLEKSIEDRMADPADPGDPADPDPDPDIPIDPVTGLPLTNQYFIPGASNFYSNLPASMFDPTTNMLTLADGGRAGYAGGGIADLRQGYFLGNLVKGLTKPFKGLTRGFKKIMKSPAGKMAIMAALGYGTGMFGSGTGNKFLTSMIGEGAKSGSFTGNIAGPIKGLLSSEKFIPGGTDTGWLGKMFLSDPSKPWSFANISPWKAISAASAAGGLYSALAGDKDDEPEWLKDWKRRNQAGLVEFAPIADPETWESIRFADGGRTGYAGGGNNDEEDHRSAALSAMYGMRRRAQEGGLMDLGGMEKDYRNEGGFVPIGGEERADDVPARLSKNEFVFTADAVRNAGGGDIDKGAEIMENLMENLEKGGKVSEESQGLEGARDMFATAQRLEGVM